MSIGASLLPELDHEMGTTRKVLSRVPDDKLGFKPHAKSWDMGSLATHVARIPSWGVETMSRTELDIAPEGQPQERAVPVTSNRALMELFEENAAAARSAIEGASDQQFLQPWSLLSAGKPVFTMPRIAVIRSMIMNHLIHHRGVLSVYLRMNDIPVPAMYGPSADES